ncbi:hypothetical protein J2Y45_004498 [Dyadobacter sp. BE34]|uniref:Large polyvalent protein-associated domain-containing protein n=1 Tax=Dyadobacter fermentans TaxID=94254 RepID=A0ABU1R184_9BACT|nr:MULTISPECIES: hypothetical protein [Dyadobacter]MDR6807168.1 hypothetical protein [Dyadobacter fermentans]MDR7044909.1 hypothetical protein [Dyadobacter sp. BE242]MDR7199355.1 hypothetical protein [Dyadobacter sp. BE34]MDR7217315.1 hypothetical protein [Dyadobacter sp. BE31]MDR7265248.1 hypothetical protein [Dyadobacter sp. BE32]
MDFKTLRRLAKERAKEKLVVTNTGIYREELDAEIKFNMAGIKECINQPFSPYLDKINLIMDGLEEALATATYIGFTTYQTHPKEHVLGYHYLETEIGGSTAYFNIQVTVQKQHFLYSITETLHWDPLE